MKADTYTPGLTGMQIDIIKAQRAPVCEHSGHLIHPGRTEPRAGLARWVAFARLYASTSNSRHAAFLRGALEAASREQGG